MGQMFTEPATLEPENRTAFRPPLQGGRLPRSNALGLVISGALLAVTGIVLILFRYALTAESALSAYPHPWWKYAVMVHVLAVPPFFFFVGSIWWRHVLRHWRGRRRRASGGGVVALALTTAASGYTLYFVGSERALEAVRLLHACGGVLGIVIAALHVVLGWRSLRVAGREGDPPVRIG